MRVLLVEDEPDLGKAIKRTLSQEAYVVDWVQSGTEALSFLEQAAGLYTVGIFDWMLPGMSGIELCRWLRAAAVDRVAGKLAVGGTQLSALPVLMLTAKDQVENRIAGLDAGADDYLVKPFSMAELLARLRALSRRSRLRFAVGYTGVMATILLLLGLGVYQAIAHAHEVTVDRELKSVSDAFHDTIESAAVNLSQLDQVPPQLLPNLCVLNNACTQQTAQTPHQLQSAYQYEYYIRLISPTGKLLATGGIHPPKLLITSPIPARQSLKDENNQTYHQIATSLEDSSQKIWAYLLVGRSLRDFDQYLRVVRGCLLVGFLISLALVAAASWGLSALAMRPIYRSYQQIQQFTTDAAHELRTPLAAIQATVESVLRLPHLPEPEVQETLTVIARQNQRLTAMVSDLLLLSRLDNEQQLATKQPCCLQDLLSDIHEEMAALAVAKSIALTLDIQTPISLPTSLPASLLVQGNEEQLYRLILNLVNNALTYTPAGGQISLGLRRTDQQVIISVADTGIGITPEHQRHIFDRFYRVDTARSYQARSHQSGNSGLGLAIAAAIAKAHQGTLTVTSQIGVGSTFTISLPFSSQTVRF